MDICWKCNSFYELSVEELYAILQLRSEVFVVEQHCYYQDMDGKDQQSMHLMGFSGNALVAYARLLPPVLSYREQSIGRVVVKRSMRGNDLGKKLMEESIAKSYSLFGNAPIKIGAQYYLKEFYEALGFIQCSDIYDDAGIDHIDMLLEPGS